MFTVLVTACSLPYHIKNLNSRKFSVFFFIHILSICVSIFLMHTQCLRPFYQLKHLLSIEWGKKTFFFPSKWNVSMTRCATKSTVHLISHSTIAYMYGLWFSWTIVEFCTSPFLFLFQFTHRNRSMIYLMLEIVSVVCACVW